MDEEVEQLRAYGTPLHHHCDYTANSATNTFGRFSSAGIENSIVSGTSLPKHVLILRERELERLELCNEILQLPVVARL